MPARFARCVSPLVPTAWLSACLVLGLSACAVGPAYERPTTPDVSRFKEAAGWAPAAPADALERGPWWALFEDPVLNQLAAQVEVSNQNVAQAVAAYAQARALVTEQRAALLPTVKLSGAGNRSANNGASPNSNYQLSLGASWEPDVWGRLGKAADGAEAGAQASAADLAGARLAAQGELSINYLSLRQTDAQSELLSRTVAAYQRSQQIAQNRYDAGIVSKSDVLQAQTQLANAQAELAGLVRQRAKLEHAMAVLLGQAPSSFTLLPAAWSPVVPAIPLGLPSTLLERRPDIAAAERRVASANGQIGIARSAYYPSFMLNASTGSGASRLVDLFQASTSVWALGLSAAQVLFNAGATTARVEGAQAGHAQAVARYRQTVLQALQSVEDQLSAAQALQAQQSLREQASAAADAVEQQALNRYRSGQVSYSEVISAQATALSARRALVQLTADRQTTAVALIQSLGGGWHAAAPGAQAEALR